MKNIKNLMLVASLFLSGSLSAATIGWSSSTTNVNENDTFTIDVIGTGFTSNVDGGGVNFGFNQNVVNVLSVSINESVWDFGGFGINTGSINNSNGTVDGIMVNTFASVAGNFIIATIEMQAIAAGSSSLLLSEYGLNPWASAGSVLNPDYVNASVNITGAPVSAVPVPAAIWLFGSGLLGLIGLAKRKARS